MVARLPTLSKSKWKTIFLTFVCSFRNCSKASGILIFVVSFLGAYIPVRERICSWLNSLLSSSNKVACDNTSIGASLTWTVSQSGLFDSIQNE